jgi:hypothetical protein
LLKGPDTPKFSQNSLFIHFVIELSKGYIY